MKENLILKIVACTLIYLPSQALAVISDLAIKGVWCPRYLIMFWAGMAYLAAQNLIDKYFPLRRKRSQEAI